MIIDDLKKSTIAFFPVNPNGFAQLHPLVANRLNIAAENNGIVSLFKDDPIVIIDFNFAESYIDFFTNKGLIESYRETIMEEAINSQRWPYIWVFSPHFVGKKLYELIAGRGVTAHLSNPLSQDPYFFLEKQTRTGFLKAIRWVYHKN